MLSGNVGAGFNIMIVGGLGVQWRTTGKIGLLPEVFDVEYGYLHHHFGLIYKFPEPKKKNNFGKKKHQYLFNKPRYRRTKGMSTLISWFYSPNNCYFCISTFCI